MLDALNPGWKSAPAVHGAAGAGLLDTCDPERRPVAQRVTGNTQAQLALMRPVPELDALRVVFSGLPAADREGRQLGDMISTQDMDLPDHHRGSLPCGGAFRLFTEAGLTELGQSADRGSSTAWTSNYWALWRFGSRGAPSHLPPPSRARCWRCWHFMPTRSFRSRL
ncbi:hypothetical protein [Kitasatospora sp. NPDC017646]|uniref:hypothetical protein n=1 Tax=Kitasatospora sp. NPDC017646 TaxID=3364024 RepID=UPI003790AE34